MANHYNQPNIPTRAKDGGPMTYAIVYEDGTSQPLNRAEFLAAFDVPHTLHLDIVAGLAVRLPQTQEAENIADETRQYNEREAKREQRWAARTVELDKPTPCGAQIDIAAEFDLEAFIEDAELLTTLVDWLDQITQNERHLFVAQVLDGKTDRELATELGIAHQNVNRRKQRVLEKLRAFLASKGQI